MSRIKSLVRAFETSSIAVIVVVVMAATGYRVSAKNEWAMPDNSSSFAVEFTDCVESIGVTLVPTERARGYVPSQFMLVGDGQPVTPLVVRSARCRSVVDGGNSRESAIVQIGLVIVPPDGTGDINNYTLLYYTTDPQLATHLRHAGVSAQHVQNIDYEFDPEDNSLLVRVPRPGSPRLVLSGTVQPSPNPAGSFLANWWQGQVKMSTNVPVINIGGADLILTTDPNSPLGQLIGGSSIGFPLVQQFNTFASAHMEVQ